MATRKLQELAGAAWEVVRRQYGVIARWQLLELGFSEAAIKHRLATGRLHRVHQGVYAVGRPELTLKGQWMAAVLAVGRGAVLSHQSAAELWGFRERSGLPIELLIPGKHCRRRKGLRIHRGDLTARDRHVREGIPLVSPVLALVQISIRLSLGELERAVNQLDALGLVDPESLRAELERFTGAAGVKNLRATLDRQTFAMSRSELERRFRRIAKRAGLPLPETCVKHNGWQVDFLWRDLGLVVETDGLRYHRTPAQQARDRRRDQAHLAAGDTPLRFTHSQVRYESDDVERVLKLVAKRLRPA